MQEQLTVLGLICLLSVTTPFWAASRTNDIIPLLLDISCLYILDQEARMNQKTKNLSIPNQKIWLPHVRPPIPHWWVEEERTCILAWAHRLSNILGLTILSLWFHSKVIWASPWIWAITVGIKANLTWSVHWMSQGQCVMVPTMQRSAGAKYCVRLSATSDGDHV